MRLPGVSLSFGYLTFEYGARTAYSCIPVEPQQNHTLSALGTLVTSWRRHLQAANLSPKTVKSYLAAVDQFEAFLAGRGMPTDVTVLRREHVESFILHLTESRSASTDPLSRFAAVLQVGGRGGRDPDLADGANATPEARGKGRPLPPVAGSSQVRCRAMAVAR